MSELVFRIFRIGRLPPSTPAVLLSKTIANSPVLSLAPPRPVCRPDSGWLVSPILRFPFNARHLSLSLCLSVTLHTLHLRVYRLYDNDSVRATHVGGNVERRVLRLESRTLGTSERGCSRAFDEMDPAIKLTDALFVFLF